MEGSGRGGTSTTSQVQSEGQIKIWIETSEQEELTSCQAEHEGQVKK